MAIKDYFQAIADAIRLRGDTTGILTPSQMPDAILAIPGGDGFIESDYSEYLTSVFNTGINVNTNYTIEVAFYAKSYVNDGHIVGQNYTSSGSAFHLTTYSNRWYVGGNGTERNFAPDSTNYPLYGMDIVYRAKTNSITMNGVETLTSYSIGTYNANFCLNTRGGSVSTSGVYRYKYIKIWDEDNELLCEWVFGKLLDTILIALDKVSGVYKVYS